MLEAERLRTWMQLEASGVAGKSIRGIPSSADPGIEAGERDRPVGMTTALLDDAPVLRLIAAGHAEREDHGPSAHRFQIAHMLVTGARRPVDVGARMGMGIEGPDLLPTDELGGQDRGEPQRLLPLSSCRINSSVPAG
jgi:hypothetical protein